MYFPCHFLFFAHGVCYRPRTMTHLLFLTPKEKEAFQSAWSAVAGDCTIQDETQLSYESEADMADKLAGLSLETPEAEEFAKKLAERLGNAESIEDVSFDDCPDDVLVQLMFALGATGVSILIGMALVNEPDADAVEGMAALTRVRHSMLAENALAVA